MFWRDWVGNPCYMWLIWQVSHQEQLVWIMCSLNGSAFLRKTDQVDVIRIRYTSLGSTLLQSDHVPVIRAKCASFNKYKISINYGLLTEYIFTEVFTNYLIEADRFVMYASGRFYKIRQTLYCTSSRAVYLISCKKC